MRPRFLSLPIRHALEGVSWASLSVRWVPTENEKEDRGRQRQDKIDALWLPGEQPEARPPLHPLNGRRFPFERFYSRIGRRSKAHEPAGRFVPPRAQGWKYPAPD